MRKARSGRLLRFAGVGAALFCVMVVAGCGDSESESPSSESGKLEPVSLRLGFEYSGAFAPLYLGVEKGFFRDNGIDLTIKEGKGSAITATGVSRGQDDFGYADLSAASTLIDKGVPLQAIATIRQNTTAAVISLAETGITTPKDLEGRSVSNTPGDTYGQIWPAFVAATGIDGSKVKRIGLDISVRTQALKKGQIDSSLSDWDYEGAILTNQGVKWNAVKFSDYGVNIIGYGMVANPSFVKENADLTRRFLAAAVKSFDYASKHSDEGVAAGLKLFPQSDPKLTKALLEAQPPTFGDSLKEGKPIGWAPRELWQNSLDTLNRYMGLKNTNPDDFYTNDYLPASAG